MNEPKRTPVRSAHATAADPHRNYPANRLEAIEAGLVWPEGLLHQGEPPRTLRDLLIGIREASR